MAKLTIHDIARMAGVSPAAVSYVLNGKKGVSEATRSKVQEVIRESGFVPDNNSRRIFFNKNYTIALVGSPSASAFNDIFYYEVARGLDYESGTFGYSVVFTQLRQDGDSLRLPEVVLTRDTDGLVFLQEVPAGVREDIRRLGLPYVVVDTQGQPEGCTAVFTDYELAAFTATRHLIDCGHTGIAFLGANRLPAFYMNTFLGYRRAMEQIHAAIPSYWIHAQANGDEAACLALDALLGGPARPTAVFCATDMIAIAAMNRAREKGMRLPEDLSFIGIDDILLSSYVFPPLTTVRINKFEMGRAAMDLLYRSIQGEPPASRMVEPGEVVERQSVSRRNTEH